MAQQTAVEWFLKEIIKNARRDWKDTNVYELAEKAKEMEKEQIENAYDAGSKEIYQDKDNAAWYYFKTYVKEQQ